jgi:peptide/nickel transport system substrate-binding protein
MRNRTLHATSTLIAMLVAVGLAACGGSSASSTSSSTSTTQGPASLPLKAGENPVGQTLYGKHRGGELTVYSSEDYEHLDPGEAYFSLDYSIMYATQRPLFSYKPDTTAVLSPDLAAVVPTTANGGITDGGKTVTVHIRPGVYFSPPVNREVTSADVAYAIDRGANPNVGNGYFVPYFGDLVGAAAAKGGPFAGVQTPNRFTIVFHLTKPTTMALIGGLSLPLSAPVPESFAGPMDKHSPTTYGTTAEVATGPYMLEANPKTGVFSGVGYQTGKSATLVRNPNWNPKTDYRPAYLNQINVNIGGDASVIGQQVLKGSDTVQLDTPSQSIVKLAYQQYPAQITFTPGAGDHYGGLDTQHGPFKNVNLRRAVWAAIDREAIVKARGGPLVAEPLTHFIYPGTDGFTQAGGYAGPNYPWNRDVNGNLAVAQQYMKAAGYPSGKYTGTGTIQVVGADNGNAPAIEQIVVQALTELGFHSHLSEVDQSVMYSKYCGVPKQEIDVCPSSGWIRDFADPLTALYVPFNGAAITSTNNSNFSQLNDPQINAAMNRAGLIMDPAAAAEAWAKVDDMLVDQAVGLPEEFDNQPNIEANNVAGVNDLWDEGEWDFSFSSLK